MNIFKRYLLLLSLVCLPLLGLNAASPQEIKNQMKGELDAIRQTFILQYAPTEWKTKHLGWDLDQEINLAKQKVDNMEKISTKAFQHIVRDFFKSMKDYHVGVFFYTTESASLPFDIKGINDKYFISYIDRDLLSYSAFPFSEGDEIVEFDGKPIHEAVLEFQKREFGSENDGTDRAYTTEIFFTKRVAKEGHDIPKGPITIALKDGNDETTSVQLIWDYKPEKITNNYSLNEKEDLKNVVMPVKLFGQKMVTSFFDLEKVSKEPHENPNSLGARKSFVPELGEIWWESNPKNDFYAYIYESEDKHRIGYIRIPHYFPFFNSHKDFEEIIRLFEKRTDALVIDQVNNPGGVALYMQGLLSMLTTKPLVTPKHRLAITAREIYLAHKIIPLLEKIENESDVQKFFGDNLWGYPINLQTVQFMLAHLNFLVDEWKEGKTITELSYLFGGDHINPNPNVRYTKPILVLVNNLDFSGGDFFPAILQDNNRATIFGTKTSGAGGCVESTTFPSRFGIAYYQYTTSIAERVDKAPIENLGVTPDIEYELTEGDLRSGYKGYKDAVNEAVRSLLKPKEVTIKIELDLEKLLSPDFSTQIQVVAVDQVDEVDQVDQADKADEVNHADQADEVVQADEVGQVDQADEVVQADKVDEVVQADEVGQADKVDQLDQADDVKHADQVYEVDQVDEEDPLDKMDEVDQVDDADQVEDVDNSTQ